MQWRRSALGSSLISIALGFEARCCTARPIHLTGLPARATSASSCGDRLLYQPNVKLQKLRWAAAIAVSGQTPNLPECLPAMPALDLIKRNTSIAQRWRRMLTSWDQRSIRSMIGNCLTLCERNLRFNMAEKVLGRALEDATQIMIRLLRRPRSSPAR